MRSVASSLMTAAATKFVVAHEYAHILAGHFAELGVQLDIQKLLSGVGLNALAARELGGLVKAYAEYPRIPLRSLAQRLIDAQMQGDA
jgi:hypothetical protein